MHSHTAQVRIWYRIECLPGYIVHQHISDNQSQRSPLYKELVKERKKLTVTEAKQIILIALDNLTLMKETDLKAIQKAAPKYMNASMRPLSENLELEAQLLYLISKKSSKVKRKKKKGAFHETIIQLTEIENFKTRLAQLSDKLPKKSKQKQKLKEDVKSFTDFKEKQVPQPFHYFGNSINYMKHIKLILDASTKFELAKTVRDATCGSATISFYLASEFKEKNYIASDINEHLINILKYIQDTKNADIEKTYTAYYNQVFNIDDNKEQINGTQKADNKPQSKSKEQKEVDFDKLVSEFNLQQENNALLLFLQNNACFNVIYKKNGTIQVPLKLPSTSLNTVLSNLGRCKEILAKSKIQFVQSDIQELIHSAKEDEFYFITPPHQHDDKDLYLTAIDFFKLRDLLNALDQKSVPYLMTYGDNAKIASTDMSKFMETYRFSYLDKMVAKNSSKRMTIYVAPSVIDISKLPEIVCYFYQKAEKDLMLTSQKKRQFEEIPEEDRDYKIIDALVSIQERCDLAQGILRDLKAQFPTIIDDYIKQSENKIATVLVKNEESESEDESMELETEPALLSTDTLNTPLNSNNEMEVSCNEAKENSEVSVVIPSANLEVAPSVDAPKNMTAPTPPSADTALILKTLEQMKKEFKKEFKNLSTSLNKRLDKLTNKVTTLEENQALLFKRKELADSIEESNAKRMRTEQTKDPSSEARMNLN